jgi:hypothetical protein
MKNVAGLFESEATADQAINALQEAGFSRTGLSKGWIEQKTKSKA